MVKVCAADGWNMLHAAIVYKRVEVINKILEYGTGTYDGLVCLYSEACVTILWKPWDQLKWLYYTICPDFPGHLVYLKSYLGTITKCVDYAGILILLSIHINRLHCMQNIVIN